MPLPRLLLVLAVACLALFPPAARAVDVPRQMTFQGRLVRADGSPETAPQDLRFVLYATATGGSPLWEESHPATPVTNGYYAVVLGVSTPLPPSAFDGRGLYLGVSIQGQSELTPRLAVASVPYALRADDSNRLEGRTASTFADAGHTHNLVPLADDSNKLQGRAAASFADASHGHSAATPTTEGFMSAADKTKLNGTPGSYGNGLALTSGTLSVSFPATGGTNGTTNIAARSNHTHALTCSYYTATGNTSATVSTAWCAANEILTGGGCTDLEASAVGNGITFGPTGPTFVSGATPTGGPGYVCRTHTTVAPTAYAICCRNVP